VIRRLLFVCTGNTCRSPLAEALARSEGRSRECRDVEAASAGTFAADGDPASGLAVRVARRRGLDLSGHRSRPLTAELVTAADLVVCMTQAHLDAVRFLVPEARASLSTDYLPSEHASASLGVPDPMGGTEAEYEKTADILSECVRGLFDRFHDSPAPGMGCNNE
jgi:protein-tyrosine-phosphatase